MSIGKFIDDEIERRRNRGTLIQAGVPDGVKTFREFMEQPLILGLDFVTAHQAWEAYESRNQK